MIEKELLSQLNKLKNIKPSSDWKNSNREILFNQISRGNPDQEISRFDILKNMLPHNMFSCIPQPVLAAILIVFIVIGGGVASLNASRDTKPGDSLYIAKIISEKAHLAVTFDKTEKVKLGIEFAGNRTKEITQILAEKENIIKEKQAKVEKLTKDFKKEINIVKSRIEKISEDEKMKVFSANFKKSDRGIEVSKFENNSSELATSTETANNGAENFIEKEVESGATNTTSEYPYSKDAEQPNNITKVLAEAEKLFDEQDYSGTIDKLTEVNSIIDNADSVVDSADEIATEEICEDTASTTDEAVDEDAAEEAIKGADSE